MNRPALTPLAGDASTRRYFRYAGPHGSRVLCRYPNRAQLRRFVDANALYRSLGLPVPRLVRIDEAKLEIVQGDLGDETLGDALARGGREGLRLAAQAVEFLAVLNPALAAPRYALPQDLYRRGRFEMNFFMRHFAAGRLPAGLSRAGLRGELRELLAGIDRLPPELAHRDYHRRNLMVTRRGGRASLVIIDHQDTRRAPRGYDLASLLFDSYGAYTPAQRRALVRPLAVDLDAPDFRRVALQRALKALGTFGYQTGTLGRARYAPAIPLTLAHAREHLGRIDPAGRRFPALGKLLAAVHH